jgi:hypothetical protein
MSRFLADVYESALFVADMCTSVVRETVLKNRIRSSNGRPEPRDRPEPMRSIGRRLRESGNWWLR